MKCTWTIVAAASLCVVATTARAQGVGIRACASADPDQFYAGGHFETGELAEHLRFRPKLEFLHCAGILYNSSSRSALGGFTLETAAAAEPSGMSVRANAIAQITATSAQ